MRFVKLVIITPIKLYQFLVSPFLGKNCRFEPSCSLYAIRSIENHGIRKGLVLSVKRIFKCHPWGKSGFDPVPD